VCFENGNVDQVRLFLLTVAKLRSGEISVADILLYRIVIIFRNLHSVLLGFFKDKYKIKLYLIDVISTYE